jgi:hypothetical protein
MDKAEALLQRSSAPSSSNPAVDQGDVPASHQVVQDELLAYPSSTFSPAQTLNFPLCEQTGTAGSLAYASPITPLSMHTDLPYCDVDDVLLLEAKAAISIPSVCALFRLLRILHRNRDILTARFVCVAAAAVRCRSNY